MSTPICRTAIAVSSWSKRAHQTVPSCPNRKDRAVEIARLRALSENIERTLDAVRSERTDAAGAADALRELISRSEVGSDPSGVHDALAYGLLFVPAFTPELNVYEDLKSSGELGLLTNPRLRQALSAMEATLSSVDASQRDMSTVQQLNFDRYLLTRIDLRPILGPMLDLPEVPSSDSSVDFILTTEFRNLAIFKLDLIVQTQGVLRAAEERLLLVGRLIEEQLQASG
jgi:hypothetical protein